MPVCPTHKLSGYHEPCPIKRGHDVTKSYDSAQWTITIDRVPANDEWEAYCEELDEGWAATTADEVLEAVAARLTIEDMKPRHLTVETERYIAVRAPNWRIDHKADDEGVVNLPADIPAATIGSIMVALENERYSPSIAYDVPDSDRYTITEGVS